MIRVNIKGDFALNVFYLNGKQVGEHKDKDILQGILDNLEQGEYLLGITTMKIYDINDMQNCPYTFTLESSGSSEYKFFDEF